jgi:hypothetical protein
MIPTLSHRIARIINPGRPPPTQPVAWPRGAAGRVVRHRHNNSGVTDILPWISLPTVK